jgi:hypothetical protein
MTVRDDFKPSAEDWVTLGGGEQRVGVDAHDLDLDGVAFVPDSSCHMLGRACRRRGPACRK